VTFVPTSKTSAPMECLPEMLTIAQLLVCQSKELCWIMQMQVREVRPLKYIHE